MQFLVVPLKPASAVELRVGEYTMQRTDIVKVFYTNIDAARTMAEAAAVKEPGKQFAIMGILEIAEALPPAKAKLVHKRINDNGEIVMVEKANGG